MGRWQRCIRQDLQKLVGELAEKEGIQVAQIQRIVIAGNTTMCHLLRGFHVRHWGWRLFCQLTFHGWKAVRGFSWNERIGYKSCDFAWDLSVCRG